MTVKPDDMTWDDYIFDEWEMAVTHDELGEISDERAEFSEVMVAQVCGALEKSNLDETKYVVDGGQRPNITSNDEWKLTEKEDALELRDVLRDAGIGDESVGVYVSPRNSKGEVVELPPDHVPADVEYEVQVWISRIMEASDDGAAASKDGMG